MGFEPMNKRSAGAPLRPLGSGVFFWKKPPHNGVVPPQHSWNYPRFINVLMKIYKSSYDSLIM